MFDLQKTYEKEVEKLIYPEKLGLQFLEKRLNEIGLYLTDNQRLELKAHFKNPKKNIITFDFTDEQLTKTKFSKKDLEMKLKDVMENVVSDIEEFVVQLPNLHDDLIQNFKGEISSAIYTGLENETENMLKEQSKIHQNFSKNLQELWGEPLNLLQALIVIARETGENYLNNKFHLSSSMDLTEKLLVRIHAKGVQVAQEILVLLKNGFADGAEARWRTLHELTVVSMFISEHGNKVAEQFINHESIERYKGAKQHNEYHVRLGAEEVSLEDMEYLEKEYSSLIEKYGKNYKHDYGWASEVLNKTSPTFRDIEASIELDHYRPYYKSASANIHANPYGVFSRLGLLHEDDDEEILLSGSSDSGLASPGQTTALSLSQMTISMLTYNTTMDSLVVCEIVKMYSDKINTAFSEVENMMWECI